MRALSEALRFLTIIPVPGRPPVNDATVLAAYPWAGLCIGLVVTAGAWLGSWLFAAAGTAVLATVLKIAVTGGLHLDGLSDLADGLGGGRDREKRLTIMADSRLGSFGAIALLCMFAMQVTVLAAILVRSDTLAESGPAVVGFLPPVSLVPLILTPLVSRGLIPLIIRLFPSARPGGMGDRNRQAAGGAALVFSIASVLLVTAGICGPAGLITVAAALTVMLGVAVRVSRRLGGLTGDVYGALIEIGDLTVLTAWLILLQTGFQGTGLMELII